MRACQSFYTQRTEAFPDLPHVMALFRFLPLWIPSSSPY